MNFIKKNLIFTVLCICMLCIISLLSIRLINQNLNPIESIINGGDTSTGGTTSIVSFNGKYDSENSQISLNWVVNEQELEVSTIQIIQNNKVLTTLEDESSVFLPLVEYDLKTGNNVFTLVVSLTDGTQLEKDVYVYVDEVNNFNVEKIYDGTTVKFVLTYDFDSRTPISVPRASYTGETDAFVLNFVSTQTLSQNGNYVHAESIYEIDFSNVEVGNYDLLFGFSFYEYGLDFNYNTTIQVINITTN